MTMLWIRRSTYHIESETHTVCKFDRTADGTARYDAWRKRAAAPIGEAFLGSHANADEAKATCERDLAETFNTQGNQ